MEDPVRQSDGVGVDHGLEAGIQLQNNKPSEEEVPKYGPKTKAEAEADTASTLNVKEFM